MSYNFDGYKKDALQKPRDIAWGNWATFTKVGDKVQGYIVDAFFRPAKGIYKDQRAVTLKQEDGKLVNVSIKRLDFVLRQTDDLRIGDPLTCELTALEDNDKGQPTKIISYYGANLPENASNKTVKELDLEDQGKGGTVEPSPEKKEAIDEMAEDAAKNLDENGAPKL